MVFDTTNNKTTKHNPIGQVRSGQAIVATNVVHMYTSMVIVLYIIYRPEQWGNPPYIQTIHRPGQARPGQVRPGDNGYSIVIHTLSVDQ